MRKALSITTLLLIVISISLDGQNRKLKKPWFKQDEANFKNLTEFLSQQDLTIANFKSQIQNLSIRDENQIWGTSKKIRAFQFGGYTSSEISLASFGKAIFSIEIIISGDDAKTMGRIAKGNPEIKATLDKYWIYSSLIDSDNNLTESYKYQYLNKQIEHQFKEEIAKDLGIVKEIDINDNLKKRTRA